VIAAQFGNTRITLVLGDITKETVNAIVNAANERLAGGGGVDGAIHRAGGPDIMKECARIRAERGGCPTGTAVITTAGRLPAKFVIHTVGPVWNEHRADECDRLLASAYTSSLQLAVEYGLRTVAFPSISTGVYGFPITRAALLVVKTVRDFVLANPLDEVRFVLFSADDYAVYERSLAAIGSSGA
jgi:O-acetyl-ADP-ribose deacetylase (regulator of RNase III)